MNKTITTNIIIAVVIGGLAFWGGMTYAKQSAASTKGNFAAGVTGGQRLARGGANGAGVNLVTGSVISKDAQSLTVSLREGGSQIIFFSSSTPIMKTATGTSEDILAGTNVVITGQKNSDGSVNAQSIQLRPVGAVGMGAGR